VRFFENNELFSILLFMDISSLLIFIEGEILNHKSFYTTLARGLILGSLVSRIEISLLANLLKSMDVEL